MLEDHTLKSDSGESANQNALNVRRKTSFIEVSDWPVYRVGGDGLPSNELL